MLGLMSTETSVGIYSNGHKVINIVITACTAITSVFLPRMSYLYREDKDSFMRLLNKGIRIIALITIPACFGLMLLSQDAILLLYGDSFRAAGSVLRIFSVLIPVKGLGDLLCYQTVISIGKEKSLVPAADSSLGRNWRYGCVRVQRNHCQFLNAAIRSQAGQLSYTRKRIGENTGVNRGYVCYGRHCQMVQAFKSADLYN